MSRTSLAKCIFIIAILLFSLPCGWAQTEQDRLEDSRSERLEEALEVDKGAVLISADELIEMLKQKALRKQEEKRHEQLVATKGTIGLHFGYDNNINADSDRRGVEYFEQYFSFSWTPAFSDYLGAEIGPWYYSDVCLDNRDTTILDYAFKAMLNYFPAGEPDFELQPGIERQWVHYPECETSSYIEDTAFLKFKHRFWERWSQDGKYEYSFSEYDKKQPRDSDLSSTSYVPGMVVEKTKHTLEYGLGLPLEKNNLRFKTKFHKETSNDHYKDYYDVYVYRITGEVGRSLTKKLYIKASSAYERKNYSHRSVPGLDVAQADKIFIHKLNLYYTLKKGWTLSYTLNHKQSLSNDDLYDYEKLSHLAGLYISF